MDYFANDEALFDGFADGNQRKRPTPQADQLANTDRPAKRSKASEEPASALPAAGSQPTNGPKPADTAKATNPTNYYAAIADVGENVPEVVRPKSSGADKASFDLKEQTLTEDELLEERKKCMHEVCLPPGYDPATAPKPTKQPPAKTYPFNLDPFQRVSVDCLEKGESVLVSAHTSAGKTVVAQYAIAMALRDKQRVVYTSPIKALSNQKYRDLYEEFKDVGLMTGDITINPDASCIVMTTEILRSMLYRGSEMLREIGWVVFDEIHYMRDKERGVVWEETIILLPDHVRFVFLSATIPNATEFAGWIAQIHHQPCHVVYTDFRPIPLQHYIFPAGGDGLYLVVDERSRFREENFQRALSSLQPSEEKSAGQKKMKKDKGGSDASKIVKVIMERHYEPVIVFSFSKKSCEALALQMAKLDFNSPEEKKTVALIFNNAIDTLSEDDKNLPQVKNILPLLQRGVGIHHSGLLPLLKEVIEILFQENLIKCLFATETFSIGLNMPAKTVVFTSVRKFDGKNHRWVTGGEYIQMSGRAGRRGLDDRGIVIMMVDEKMEPAVAKDMVMGQADFLASQFRIGYNMLLNLIRMDGIDPEDMLRNSFHQFQNDRQVPKLREKLGLLEVEVKGMVIDDEENVSEYHQINDQLARMKESIRSVVTEPIHVLQFLKPGRLVRVRDGDSDYGWGAVINFTKRANENNKTGKSGIQLSATKYIVDVLLPCAPGTGKNPPRPCPAGEKPEAVVVPVLLSLLDGVSSLCVYLPKDLRPADNRQGVLRSVEEISRRYPDGIPHLDPVEDMQITDSSFRKVVQKVQTLEERLHKNPLWNNRKDTAVNENYKSYVNKSKMQDEIKDLKKSIKKADNVIMGDELKGMKRVLRRLGFTSKDDVIEVKGRVACEINAADELVLTELIFTGYFTDLTPQQIAAVLSTFVFGEKSDSVPSLRDELAGPLRLLQDVARRVATVQSECKIQVDIEEYVAHFIPTMMEVTYAWANGAKFIEICGMTDIFEGSLIRAMRRLEELLRQLVSAAKYMGNSELENKFAVAITAIKRDIVFAASLYL